MACVDDGVKALDAMLRDQNPLAVNALQAIANFLNILRAKQRKVIKRIGRIHDDRI
jgi:hypothetical protein